MVSEYIDSYLIPRLGSLGATDAQINVTATEIERRLVSLLHHWKDSGFRKALLELGAEEGSFYTPETADIAIRALVVVAIRNSPLEDLGATRPYHKEFHVGRSPIISDAEMRGITSEAISYFDSAFRRRSIDHVAVQSDSDVFGPLAETYPITWRIFRSASEMEGGERRIRPIDSPRPRIDLANAPAVATGTYSVISSGIDPRLDGTIISILNAVATGSTDLVFFPAFKWFTRNTEKLFRVFEFVLCSDARIVTLNYCFSRDIVCKRRFLLPPSHNRREIAAQISDHRGLCKRHREALGHVSAPR